MKVQVTLNDDLVKRIDDVSKMIGASRSSLCAMFIYHGLRDYLKETDLIHHEWLKDFVDKKEQ